MKLLTADTTPHDNGSVEIILSKPGNIFLGLYFSLIEEQLIYKVVLVFGVQQSDSVIYAYVCVCVCVCARVRVYSFSDSFPL